MCDPLERAYIGKELSPVVVLGSCVHNQLKRRGAMSAAKSPTHAGIVTSLFQRDEQLRQRQPVRGILFFFSKVFSY